MNSLRTSHDPGKTAWNALTYFNLYRFLIAFLFVSLYWIGQLPEPLGVYNKEIFAITAHIFLLFSIFAQFLCRLKTPPYRYQVSILVFLDISMITLLMYASAGLNSGFGMLIVITVAGGALLCPGKIGILYAAIATIAVLTHEVYAQLNTDFVAPSYTHAGFLGISFFVTAFLGQILAGRVKESEALAERRGVDLEKLAILNEIIVQRLQSGIIVLDEELKVRLINEAAQVMLALEKGIRGIQIDELLPELASNIRKWQIAEEQISVTIHAPETQFEIQASFVRLDLQEGFQILVYLDDVSKLRQRAQQMKLASLGRLTASIAHEIRNPLGAISHAGQLLSESALLGESDKRLTNIIDEHSKRVNNIIENIVGVSRRGKPEPVIFNLGIWVKDFIDEFVLDKNLNGNDILIHTHNKEIIVSMDPTQLRQVLINLLENGIRYSKHSPFIELNLAMTEETQRPYLDVIDNGSGVTPEIFEQLFEPFFTTDSKGSGLGLYIARELCEANQASLSLYENSSKGCCFRINFSHSEKQHNLH